MANEAMDALEFDLQLLRDDKLAEPLMLQAVNSYGEKKWLSGIALILCTDGLRETEKLQKEGLADYQRDSQFFADFIKKNVSPEARAVALCWKNMIDVIRETGAELGQETKNIPLTRNGVPRKNIPGLDDGLEPGTDPEIRVSAAVRGPFIHFPPCVRHCEEKCIQMPVECGGCAVVVKEFKGLQLRRVLRRLTKVVEPWTSRARIIFKWVWVLEWVPVEVIKTIVVKCCCEKPHTHCEKKVVLDRELIGFWRCW